MLQFALAGLGVAFVPRAMAEKYIQSAELEMVLTEYMPQDIWMVAAYAQRRHNSAAMRALLDFLVQNANDI